MAGNITPAWQVIGGYTQQKATIKNGKDVAQDGSSSLPYTPEHAFTLWSQYQATDDISVGAGARYIGSMHKGSDGAVGTPAFTEGYWVADAKLGYRVNRNLDFQLNVYNLFDTDYVASINKSGYRYHPGEPRTFLAHSQYVFLIQMWGAGPTFWRTCMMYHIPGVLSPQDVARFREQLEQAEWVDGRVTTGAQGAQIQGCQQVDTRTLYAALQNEGAERG